jgi:hypothetical protein
LSIEAAPSLRAPRLSARRFSNFTFIVPAVSKPLCGIKGFGGPDKGLRSKARAGKLCRNNGVGMFANEVGARSGMT